MAAYIFYFLITLIKDNAHFLFLSRNTFPERQEILFIKMKKRLVRNGRQYLNALSSLIHQLTKITNLSASKYSLLLLVIYYSYLFLVGFMSKTH